MNAPGFSAASSLYPARGQYNVAYADADGSLFAQSVAPAYFPGSATQRDCNTCLNAVATGLATCIGIPAATAVVVCAATGWFTFGISCAAAGVALAAAISACDAGFLVATGICAATTCCPKLCGTPNPLDPGSGCCDDDEGCVDQNDPNSRHGCCPSDQAVCGGKCCEKGASCCGNACCPPGSHCCGTSCCANGIPCCGNSCCSLLPPGGGTPPPPPPHACAAGNAPCGLPDHTGIVRTCCPPGLPCCSFSDQFGPNCKTSCLH